MNFRYMKSYLDVKKYFVREKTYWAWAIALVVLFCVYSFSYIFKIIMPQYGWWHYFAWRINEGEVLYKDMYLFIPPYMPLLTSWLYKVLGNHFILYTLLIGFPAKIVCVLIMYRCICKIVHPFFAFLSVFCGAYFGASYYMDVLYDYNPLLTLICLLIADNFMRLYEKKKWYNVLFIGICIGILLMSKQSLGISMAIVSFIMLIVIQMRENVSCKSHILLIWGIGVVVGILPGIVYLIRNESVSQFLDCMRIATGAKGGTSGLIMHLFVAFIDKSQWIVAVCLFFLYFISRNKEINKLAKERGIALITFLVLVIYIHDGYDFLVGLSQTNQELHWGIVVFPILLFLLYLFFNRERLQLSVAIFGLIFFFLLIVVFWGIGKIEPEVTSMIYNTVDIPSFRRVIIRMMSYAFLLFWISELFDYFVKRTNKDYKVLMFMTIIGTHFLVGIMSAEGIEELFMLLYIPFTCAYLFSSERDVWGKRNVFFTILICCGAVLSLICKLYIPYDWQGWRIDPVSHSDVVCSVNGLEGLKVSERENDIYETFYDLIIENTDANDTVYQFGNIPLFNVLTERKIPAYGVIPWFDVCPDSVAEADAINLCNDKPKMVIWHNMDDFNWNLLEKVFRNGETSGQRKIKEDFYEGIVKRNYTMLAEEWNGRDGTIQLWLLNE